MDFYNTVHILEVGSHLFHSYKNTRVKAISQPALHIIYKAVLTDTGQTLLLRWENYSHLQPCVRGTSAPLPFHQNQTRFGTFRRYRAPRRVSYFCLTKCDCNTHLLQRGTKLAELARKHLSAAMLLVCNYVYIPTRNYKTKTRSSPRLPVQLYCTVIFCIECLMLCHFVNIIINNM